MRGLVECFLYIDGVLCIAISVAVHRCVAPALGGVGAVVSFGGCTGLHTGSGKRVVVRVVLTVYVLLLSSYVEFLVLKNLNILGESKGI